MATKSTKIMQEKPVSLKEKGVTLDPSVLSVFSVAGFYP
jgi:hypothetical protein